MNKVVANLRSLHNPLSLAGVAALAFTRGLAYVATGTNVLPLDGYHNAPTLPGGGVLALGLMWVAVGLFFAVSMIVRRLFLAASALMVGMSATWVVVHIVNLCASPDWDSVIGLVTCGMLVPVVATLAVVEIVPPGKPSIGKTQSEWLQ